MDKDLPGLPIRRIRLKPRNQLRKQNGSGPSRLLFPASDKQFDHSRGHRALTELVKVVFLWWFCLDLLDFLEAIALKRTIKNFQKNTKYIYLC